MKKFSCLKEFCIIISVFILMACSSSEPDMEVIINDQYAMMLPGFLQEVTDLHEEASLQYVNYLREFYVLVIDEPILEVAQVFEDNVVDEKFKDGLDGYSHYMIDYMINAMTPTFRSPLINTQVNSLPARLFHLEGKVQGDADAEVEVFYTIAFIQGKDQYYQVLTWTLLDRKDKYQKTMNDMIFTFREIDALDEVK